MTDDRMTRSEAVLLCRFAKACCPQQAFDELTPDAWFELLRDLRFEDCKEAIVKVVRQKPFVSPSEIRSHISSVRTDRIMRFGHIAPPSGMFADDDQEFHKEIAWINAVKRRVADGELTRDEWDAEQAAIGATGSRELPALEGVFRHVSS
jgi:hypothetical protein